ncbi:MAG: TerB N-terminal domain-containing protein [Defluviitaleaceae bacterium]|nr:TerB N-terminal domain-containing protein [Defluviitaleaceae bacterium]MCL2238705.1 TerB N-terminal domain-containing protein [Defluviitaleaceae bacterium]
MRTANSSGPSHSNPFEDPPFAEIELTESAAAKPGPAPQPIAPRAYDPLRARFRDMRLIANYTPYSYPNDGWLFHEQAKFMADVVDDYPHRTAFSAFYPYYQRMGYEQLRTYFTWRTVVRGGAYPFVGASYLFLYIYELLSCIGVAGPEEGLRRLVALWRPYREAVPALNQYLPGWIKDFHIYYPMAQPFADFVREGKLERFYSGGETATKDDPAARWMKHSGYDMANSKFYAGNEELVQDYLPAVFHALREWCAPAQLEDVVLYDVSDSGFWKPFAQALFYPWLAQRDRRVEMPGREVYHCRDNRWSLERAMPFSGSRELVGYILRKTESLLRRLTKHRHKLTADPQVLVHSGKKLAKAGLTLAGLDETIEQSVLAHHRERNKIAVTVDPGSLARIREEAQGTQDKLTVEEEAAAKPPPPSPPPANPPPSPSPGWDAFAAALTPVEREALRLLCQGEADTTDIAGVKSLADAHGVMLEVLAEGINEKAADCISDNVLDTDGGLALYEEYRGIILSLLTPA